MTSNATGNAEVQVSTLVAEQMRAPSITVLPTGGWIAVWGADSEDDVEFSHTVFQRFDAAGNPVGAETQVGDPEVFLLMPRSCRFPMAAGWSSTMVATSSSNVSTPLGNAVGGRIAGQHGQQRSPRYDGDRARGRRLGRRLE